MTNDELSTRYRNLLIALAKQHQATTEKSVLLRTEAEQETVPGRKSGLYCLARSYNKHRLVLRSILHRNSSVLRQFFKTTDIEAVSKKEILLIRKRSSNTVSPASKPSSKQKP